MILVLGGTTEGRKTVATLDKAGKPFVYSTRGDIQHIEAHNALRITGALDMDGIMTACADNNVKVIVDAAHPFASQLHENVSEAAKFLGIPVVRFERRYPERDEGFIWCDDFEDAVKKLKKYGVKSLLALTGVQTISKLKGFWKENECIFRILDREDSKSIAEKNDFPQDKLVFYEAGGHIDDLLRNFNCDAILTKESGASGKFYEKTEDARKAGVKIFVVKRPSMPGGFITITGEYGLRKAVEKLLPGFFELRSGFTTGTCATAAAIAALKAIVDHSFLREVAVILPDGEEISLPVKDVSYNGFSSTASVIKDAGDDPDVTDGVEIVATVTLASHGSVRFFGAEGIGRVTLPGLGLPIGDPAINPVPRKMMTDALLQIYPEGCDVTISVPGGAELAKRTFNPRIGVIGGISIIGTTGVVMPFSNEAFLESIRREMEVAKASGCERVVLNSGARSEKAIRCLYPDLPSAAFIHYGNAIGETLEMACRMEINKVTLGIMIGKAVKLAEGNTDTHSHKVTIDREFLADVAKKAGCGPDALATIPGVNMAKELWSVLSQDDSAKFFPFLMSLCWDVCRQSFRRGELTLMLITDTGNVMTTIN